MHPAWGIIVTLLTFFAGFLSATYFAWRQAEVAAVNDHIDDLRQIEALATSYWLGEDAALADINAHRLRGKLHATAVFSTRFKHVLGQRAAEYSELDGRLFDLATGGDFQTGSFHANPETAVKVMQVCNELRALLRTVRRQIYWIN